MLQQVMTNPKEITFREIPVPEITADQVLVKIMKIGVCGSDIHVYHGKHPFTSYPVTQGHEVSGEIVKLGENVKNFTVGQKITIQPQVVCGKCYPCRHGFSDNGNSFRIFRRRRRQGNGASRRNVL